MGSLSYYKLEELWWQKKTVETYLEAEQSLYGALANTPINRRPNFSRDRLKLRQTLEATLVILDEEIRSRQLEEDKSNEE